MTHNPALDLVLLKKLCNELQRELAYSMADKEKILKLSEDVIHQGERLAEWAKHD